RLYHPTVTLKDTTIIYGSASLWHSLVSPFVGFFQDKNRLGLRGTAAVGATLVALATLASSSATSVLGLAALNSVFGVGVSLAYTCPLVSGYAWMPERKGAVSGFVVAGFGAGAAVFDAVATAVVNPRNIPPDPDTGYYSEEVAGRVPAMYLILGSCYLLLGLFGSWMIANPPENGTKGRSNSRYLRDRDRCGILVSSRFRLLSRNFSRVSFPLPQAPKEILACFSGSYASLASNELLGDCSPSNSSSSGSSSSSSRQSKGVGGAWAGVINHSSSVATVATGSLSPMTPTSSKGGYGGGGGVYTPLQQEQEQQREVMGLGLENATTVVPGLYPANDAAPAAVEQRQLQVWDLPRECDFYHLALSLLCTGVSGLYIAGNYKGIAQEKFPDADRFLSILGSVASLFNATGRVLAGLSVDRYGCFPTLLTQAGAGTCVLLALFAAQGHRPTFFLAICLLHALYGSNFAIYPTLTAEFFGVATAGPNYGLVFSVFGLGSFLMMLWLAAGSKNSDQVFLTCAGVYLTGTVSVALLWWRRRRWKRKVSAA
ncbi:unnamed protein product, partial [Hapterophycus canaliculatus]